jgi:Cytochrome c554 and c-prime
MNKIRRIVLTLTAVSVLALGGGFMQKASGQEATYVGVAKCKICHSKQHKVWSGSRHAKAFDALKTAEQKDPKCLGCHVTGYRQTKQAPPELVNVQCESCHGPGSLYIKIHPKKDKEGARKAGMIAHPDPESCKSCHNAESPYFKGFDYAKAWEQIKHSK